MPSWQLSFDPQVWVSKHPSLGLMTRYRRTLPSLRTNLSIGADLEFSPGSRMETGDHAAPSRARSTQLHPGRGAVRLRRHLLAGVAVRAGRYHTVAARAPERGAPARLRRLRLRQQPLGARHRYPSAPGEHRCRVQPAEPQARPPPWSRGRRSTSSHRTAPRFARPRRASSSVRVRRRTPWT